MLLIISHATEIKGTTHFFLEYLQRKNIPYVCIQHPIPHSNLKCSTIKKYDGHTETQIKKYRQILPYPFDLVHHFFISTKTLLTKRYKINAVFSFGSYNSIPALLLKPLLKYRTVFWGVDYSLRRFNNSFLNQIYQITETLACRYSNSIINSSYRQEDIRIKLHRLNKTKSTVVKNGIAISFTSNPGTGKQPALIYIGSLSIQHGLSAFIEELYGHKKISQPLLVFGDGNEYKQIHSFITKQHLTQKIHLYGNTPLKQILRFINNWDGKLVGIAPYTSTKEAHTFFGDSLKIKEYLSFGIPYVANNTVHIDDDLIKYGFKYSLYSEIPSLLDKAFSMQLDLNNLRSTLKQYEWPFLFQKALDTINISY